MNSRKTFSLRKRIIAVILSLAMIFNICAVGITAIAIETPDTASLGKLMVKNYESLSEAEKGVLQSSLLKQDSFTYKAPEDSGLVSVDADEKTVTAKPFTDDYSNRWVPVSARVIYAEGFEPVELTLNGENYEGAFSYTENNYSVEVDYEFTVNVDTAIQQSLLDSIPALKSGMDTMTVIGGQQGIYDTLAENIYLMKELVDGIVVNEQYGTTVKITGEPAEAILYLYNQAVANATAPGTYGKFNLSLMYDAYYASTSKIAYLAENGAAVKTEAEASYKAFKAIADCDLATYISIYIAINQNKPGFDAGKLEDMGALTELAFDTLVSKLQPVSDSAVNSGAWKILNVNYKEGVTVGEILAAEPYVTQFTSSADVTLKSKLQVASTTLRANVNRHDVTVNVAAQVIRTDLKDDATLYNLTYPALVLTVADGTSDNAIIQMVKDAELEKKALADWNTQNELYNIGDTYYIRSEKFEDNTYNITYTPKEYDIDYVSGFGTTNTLPKKVPYGYNLTLPKHSNENKVYDYSVNNESKLQSAVIRIEKDTEILRTEGKPWSIKSVNAAVALNTSDAFTAAVLQNSALTSDVIRYREPDENIVSVVGVNPFYVTAPNYPSGIAGIDWVADECILVVGGNPVKHVPIVSGEATLTDNFDSITVTYKLNITTAASEEKMLVALNLASILRSEYNAQKTEMDKLIFAPGGIGDSDLLKGLSQLDKKTLNQIGLFKDKFAPAGQAAIEALLNECVNSDTDVLYLYEYLSSYKTNGMGFYYKDTNYEKIVSQLGILGENIDAILADPALTEILETVDAMEYMDRIQSVANGIHSASLDDKAPNAKIIRSSALDTLVSLANSISKAPIVEKITTIPEMFFTTSRAAAAPDRVRVTINLEIEDSKGETVNTDKAVITYPAGETVTNTHLNDVMAALLNMETNLSVDKVHYTRSGSNLSIGDILSVNKELDFKYTPNAYTVNFSGITYASQTVYIDNRDVSLPVHTTVGYNYKVTIGDSAFSTSASNAVYTFTPDQLDSLFVGGSYTIAVEEIDENRQKVLEFIDDLNSAIFNAGASYSKGGKNYSRICFVPVEDAEGNISVILRLTPSANIPYTGVLTAVATALTGGGLDLRLGNSTFYDVADGKLYVQSLIDMLLYSGIGLDTALEVISENGDLNEMTIDGASVIETETVGAGKIVEAADVYGGKLIKSKIGIGDINGDFYITMEDFDTNASQLLSARNAVKKIKEFADISLENGDINVVTDVPDAVYQVILASMLATGQISLNDVNSVETNIAVSYLWNLIKPMLEDKTISVETIENTVAKFGKNVNLSSYSASFKKVQNIINIFLDNSKITEKASPSGAYAVNISFDDISGIIEKLNLPAVAADVIGDTSLNAGVVLEIANTKTTEYEAIILDTKASGITNKIGFRKSLADAVSAANNGSMIVLTKDYNGDIVTDKSLLIDLNGKKITGDLKGKYIKLVDSNLANAGVIEGETSVGTDFRENNLYAIDYVGNELQVKIDSKLLDKKGLPAIREIAVSLGIDLLLNYYTTASLSIDSNNIYNVSIDDIVGLLASRKLEDLNKVIDVIDCKGIADTVNKLMADLTDFNAVSSAISTGNAVASYPLDIKFWDVKFVHNAAEDYLTADIFPSAKLGKSETIGIYVSGTEEEKKIAADMFKDLGKVVKINTLEASFTNIELSSGKVVDINAGFKADVEIDLTTKKEYAEIVAILLANATTGNVKADLLEALSSYYTTNNSIQLKDAIEAAKVSDLVSAFKKLNTSAEFNDIVSVLGLNTAQTTDAAELYKLYKSMFVTVGKVLNAAKYNGGAKTLGSIADGFGCYGFTRTLPTTGSFSVSGVKVEYETDSFVKANLKLFNEYSIHVYDKNGLNIYSGDDITVALQLATADNGNTIEFLGASKLVSDVTVSKALIINGNEKLDQNGFKFILTDGGSIDADGSLIIKADNEYKSVDLKIEGGRYKYSLTVLVPNHDGKSPVVKIGDKVYGAKIDGDYIILDAKKDGLTESELREVLSMEANNAESSVITKVDKDSSGLVVNGGEVTFKATNTATSVAAEKTYKILILGDTNMNGVIDAGDATLMAHHFTNISSLAALEQKIADMNCNGEIDAGDATRNMIKFTSPSEYESMLNK